MGAEVTAPWMYQLMEPLHKELPGLQLVALQSHSLDTSVQSRGPWDYCQCMVLLWIAVRPFTANKRRCQHVMQSHISHWPALRAVCCVGPSSIKVGPSTVQVHSLQRQESIVWRVCHIRSSAPFGTICNNFYSFTSNYPQISQIRTIWTSHVTYILILIIVIQWKCLTCVTW